ncbi:MAG: JmjC domain-containing protein [Solirubrobacteraceae bacterium]
MTTLLDVDDGTFADAFGRRPCAVHHLLRDHPLLTVEAIAQLAEQLADDRVEHNLGDLPLIVGQADAPRSALPPGEIARSIETNGCWMVLKNIEVDARYAELLDATLDEVAACADGEGAMGLREGFIFLSAPGSVTPAHLDPEHNLLLQVRGEKTINVGRFPDPDTEQVELERYYAGGGRNIEWLPSEPQSFSMLPGDGVYVPVHAPHWVTVPDNVAVSLSITFRTQATDDAVVLHRVNRGLRRLRLSPQPIGRHQASDRAKVLAGRALRAVRLGSRVTRRPGKRSSPR